MQASKEDFVRLQQLKESKGMTWQQLAAELSLSYTMVYYVKKGLRTLGVKARRRLREAEVKAGLRSADANVTAVYREDLDREFSYELMMGLKGRWCRRVADRDQITIAVRLLFPTNSAKLISWLKKSS